MRCEKEFRLSSVFFSCFRLKSLQFLMQCYGQSKHGFNTFPQYPSTVSHAQLRGHPSYPGKLEELTQWPHLSELQFMSEAPNE